MFRALHVFLMINALLLCPLKCMGGIAVCDIEGEQVQGCGCCQSPELPSERGDSQGHGSPTAPDDNCSCTSCLCRGAILPDDHPPLDVADAMLELPAVEALATAGVAAGELRVTAGSFPPFALQSGRLIRCALQSLQV